MCVCELDMVSNENNMPHSQYTVIHLNWVSGHGNMQGRGSRGPNRSLERHFCKPAAIKTELNTRVSIQSNKLDLATSYVARLQHCVIASIAVTATAIALWLKHRMDHLSSRGPYLSSRKAADSVSPSRPHKSRS